MLSWLNGEITTLLVEHGWPLAIGAAYVAGHVMGWFHRGLRK